MVLSVTMARNKVLLEAVMAGAPEPQNLPRLGASEELPSKI